MPEVETVGGGCECWVVPEHMWTTHYGAVEPGSAVEHNPDCPQHRTPYRVQRRRTKGWRMPPNTVYVGRPTIWQNVFRIGSTGWMPVDNTGVWSKEPHEPLTREQVVQYFRYSAEFTAREFPEFYEPLRGKNLACWCPLDQACHADVLLELANRDTPTGAPEMTPV